MSEQTEKPLQKTANKLSRRDFLKVAGILTGSALLAACTPPSVQEEVQNLTPQAPEIENDAVTHQLAEVRRVAELPENKELLKQIEGTYENWGILNPFPIEYLINLASEKEKSPDSGKITFKVHNDSELPDLQKFSKPIHGLLGPKISKYIHFIEPDNETAMAHAQYRGISTSLTDPVSAIHETAHEMDFCSPGADPLNIVLKKELIKAQLLTSINLSPNIGAQGTENALYNIVGRIIIPKVKTCLSTDDGTNVQIRNYIHEIVGDDLKFDQSGNIDGNQLEQLSKDGKLKEIGKYIIDSNRTNPRGMSEELKAAIVPATRDALTEQTSVMFETIGYADPKVPQSAEGYNIFPNVYRLLTDDNLKNLIANYISLAREEQISYDDLAEQVHDPNMPVPPYEIEYI